MVQNTYFLGMIDDKNYLRIAIEIALEGIKDGCGPFGTVILNDGKIVASSNNRVVLSNDPTAHAEILAIREAAAIMKTHDLSGCTLYSSCEPCPMCLGAIYWSGIKRVVYASDRNEAASAGFNDKMIYKELTLDPADRNITFVRLEDPAADVVFNCWDQFENKIRY